MSIDFEIPAEAKAIREKVRKWVHEECIPAEKELDSKPLAEVLGPLRAKARARGLWCPWVPKEYGGMGLEGAVNIIHKRELDDIADEAERAERHKELTDDLKRSNTAIEVAGRFHYDDVIDPADTRDILLKTLESLPPPPLRTSRKRLIEPF